VLVGKEKKKERDKETAFLETTAPKRPHTLEGDVLQFMNDDERWVAVVGLLDGRPYEIFTGSARGFFLPDFVTKGNILKNRDEEGQSRYDFQFTDKDGYKITMEGLSRQFNTEYWNYAKLISGILRHGMPLPFVVHLVENLQLELESINTWKNGVVRALKKYIPDGTKIPKEKCSSCGAEGALEYKEGCETCTACGHSKCS
jgi:ribonucleoside-diphosphate reductase alpha chain